MFLMMATLVSTSPRMATLQQKIKSALGTRSTLVRSACFNVTFLYGNNFVWFRFVCFLKYRVNTFFVSLWNTSKISMLYVGAMWFQCFASFIEKIVSVY